MSSSFDDLIVQPDEVRFIEDDDCDHSSLIWCLSDLNLPEPAPLVPSQDTRGAAVIATETDRPWLDTRGAANYDQAPQTTPRTTPKIVRRRPCQSRHRRVARARPRRRRSSRRTSAPTRAGPDGDQDPDGEHSPRGRQGLAGGVR